MSMNPDTRSATISVSGALMHKIRSEYDVFSRNDFSGEIILDTCGFTGEESAIADLAALTHESPEDLCDRYLILHHDEDLDDQRASETRVFNVSVRRVAYSEKTFSLEAASEQEAESKALAIAPDHEFSEDSSDYTVEMCEPQDDPADWGVPVGSVARPTH